MRQRFNTFIPLAALMAISVAEAQEPVPLKEAKFIIEHNATDRDTGFQAKLDGEDWQDMSITGPNGVLLQVLPRGRLKELGLTEMFFESVEPENTQVPIRQLLLKMPAGDYAFSGSTKGGGLTTGTARFTHRIPAGAKLLSPANNSAVPFANLPVSWSPVDKTIDGKPITIIAYQLIIEKAVKPHPNMIGKRGSLSMYLPPAVTQLTVPKEFLEPATRYDWEVLAIEPSGNQTLSSGKFRTE